ncbi:unnamed protein product [Brassicogethes aeneus]|uniref:Methoprene-tolerant protein n=1 Tax=Brassicogethes aeneus TaxID=1431903 RepID=A0A9P0AN86_BRAAE|nr:unnamed protein product [Brassicogethes aeneus]
MLAPSEYCASFIDDTAMQTNWYPPTRGTNNNFVMDPRYDQVLSFNSNNRHLRNQAEKQRRDRLNSYIGELASLVPMVARSTKRMDKTSILRIAAAYLRIYQTLLNNKGQPHMDLPKHVDQFLLDQLVCDQLGGFLLILTSSGKVVFISHTVENLLAHLQTDLMGQSLFNITAPEDHDRLRTYLRSEGVVEAEWRKYFKIKLKRAGPRSESPVYETVKMMGMHRSQINNHCGSPSSSPGSSRDLTSPTSSTGSNTNDVLVFFVRICRPEPLLEMLIEASKDEYVTRHLIDGRIISCDQRISLVAGYMIDEVSGMSAFKYMHKDDVRWVMIALRQMYDRGESRGSSCYRLISRNGQFIYLRTFGFLEIDDQGTVESFVCVNVQVNEIEGLQLIDQMKKKFSAIIAHNNADTPPRESDDRTEDPQQVDEAVAHLMHNLPLPCSDPRLPKNNCAGPSSNGRKPSLASQLPQPVAEPSAKRPHARKTAAHQVARYKTAKRALVQTDVDANLNNKRLKSPSSPQTTLTANTKCYNNARVQITELPHTEPI